VLLAEHSSHKLPTIGWLIPFHLKLIVKHSSCPRFSNFGNMIIAFKLLSSLPVGKQVLLISAFELELSYIRE
jgi:hypothetical protein